MATSTEPSAQNNNNNHSNKDKRDGKDREVFKDPNNTAFTIASPLSRHRRTASHDSDARKQAHKQKQTRDLGVTQRLFDITEENTSPLSTSPPSAFKIPLPKTPSSASGISNGTDHVNGILSTPSKSDAKSHKRPVPDPKGFTPSSSSSNMDLTASRLAPPAVDLRPTSPTTPPNRRRKIQGEDSTENLKRDGITPPTPTQMKTRNASNIHNDYETPTRIHGERHSSFSDLPIPRVIFNPPPSPTPDKRRPRGSTVYAIRYKSNINPFTPEGRSSLKDLKQNEGEYDLVSPYKEDSNSAYSQQFEQLALIGKGSYGEVHKCRNRIDGCLYAVKRAIRRSRGARDRQNVLREVYGLAAITDHAHILRYYGAWEEDERLCIQTEFCEGGSLKWDTSYVRQFSEAELIQLLGQVTQGLHHIHSLGLVHLDIKPDNIYLKFPEGSGPRIYKIGDLGLMNEANDAKIFMDGDCKYLSRELLEDNMSALRKSDIFSLGASMYELSRGKLLPQGGDEWREIRDGIIECSSNYSQEFWNLIKSLIHPDPTMRPASEEILQHPLITGNNELFSHPVACCPLRTALEDSQREILHLRQQIASLEEQLVTNKRNLLSPSMHASPNDPFPAASDMLTKMQL